MGGGHLLHVYNSSHAYRIKRLTAYIPMSVKRYSEGKRVSGDHHDEHGQEERAPSLAEEFRRVADERSRQGVASHNLEKAQEGFEEAATGDHSDDLESVKERFKEPPGVGNLRKED